MAKKEIVPEYAPVLLGKVALSPHDSQFEVQYPTLAQLLWPRYQDDKHLSREPGLMTVKVDGSLFRITVICPTEGVQVTLSTSTLIGVLDQLERLVASAAAEWVPTYDKKLRRKRGLDMALEE